MFFTPWIARASGSKSLMKKTPRTLPSLVLPGPHPGAKCLVAGSSPLDLAGPTFYLPQAYHMQEGLWRKCGLGGNHGSRPFSVRPKWQCRVPSLLGEPWKSAGKSPNWGSHSSAVDNSAWATMLGQQRGQQHWYLDGGQTQEIQMYCESLLGKFDWIPCLNSHLPESFNQTRRL